MSKWNCNICKEKGIACTYCDDGSEFERISNADKIRSMTDEELAEYLPMVLDFMCQPTKECIRNTICNMGECEKTKECALNWLQSEVED